MKSSLKLTALVAVAVSMIAVQSATAQDALIDKAAFPILPMACWRRRSVRAIPLDCEDVMPLKR